MNKFPKKHSQVFFTEKLCSACRKSSFRHAVRLLRRCLNFFFFRASLNATVPVSPSQGSNPSAEFHKKHPRCRGDVFFGPLEGMSMLCILRPRRPSLNATVPVSPFAPENSPPDCFLNVAHPLRVRIPPPNSKKNIPAAAEMLFLARSKG